jgi:outer membrane protein assembly factor BamE
MLAQLKARHDRSRCDTCSAPLVTDIFHGDRWDYVYYRERGSRFEQRKISVHSTRKAAQRIGGDVAQRRPRQTPGSEAGGSEAGGSETAMPGVRPRNQRHEGDEGVVFNHVKIGL